MFDSDKWLEIFNSISKNKLRSFLTGISVAWGIFMLVILMGFVNGLKNGIKSQFSDANNSIWVSGQRTSIPYDGIQAGKQINLTNQDYEIIKKTISGVENVSARKNVWGATSVKYNKIVSNFDVKAIHPEHQNIELVEMTKGRFLNQKDMDDFRKVVVIGKVVEDILFKGKESIGQYIQLNDISFKVVGVYKDMHDAEMRRIYLPLNIAQKLMLNTNSIGMLTMTIGNATVDESLSIVDKIRNKLASIHNFDPNDLRALYINNVAQEFENVSNVLLGISAFIILIGIMTIIAGVVGVSNIMMVVVKERTKEFGIRKALGATPFSILSNLLLESIIITAFAGYIGLILGVLLLDVFSKFQLHEFIKEPQINISIAIIATIVLVISGAIAGLVPAIKAASVKPIEALKED